jgi:hypothetical protein
MNKPHFDSVAQIMTSFPSRRNVLRGLAGVGFGLGIARLPDLAEARKKRKRKKHKKRKPQAKPNEYGCLEVNDPCSSADQCCSGVCEGKTCRAHDTGTCKQGGEQICVSNPPKALRCNNDGTCTCFGTTAGSIGCARYEPETMCADCRRDADCTALGYPPGTFCAPVSEGICAGDCPTGMACLVPCGVEFPPPPEA